RSPSSRATRPCRTPCAARRPSSVCCRSRSDPRTLTHTVACFRSVVASTLVTVAKQMRGSLSVGTASESTCRIASLTRRFRPLLARDDHLPLRAQELDALRSEVTLDRVEQLVQLPVTPSGASDRQTRALPQVVMVHLGHRRPESLVQLGSRRLQELPFPLERAVLRKVQLDAQDADEPGLHGFKCAPRTRAVRQLPRAPRRAPSARPRAPRAPRGCRLPSHR